MKKYYLFAFAFLFPLLCGCSERPSVTATAKGPNQINLTWSALDSPGYGYSVEIQSDSDSRYSSYTVLSGPSSPHYQRLPYWVTESNYKDPQDGSAAQFMCFSLNPNTLYNFRVRAYSGYTNPTYGSYSRVARATTANYAARYVSKTGSDSNGGTNPNTDAWLTINHAISEFLTTGGRVVLVGAGTYTEGTSLASNGSGATSKIVLMANPGDAVILNSTSSGIGIGGNYTVVDGITSRTAPRDSILLVTGEHDALVNAELDGLSSPSTAFSPKCLSAFNLFQGLYVHDVGVDTDNQSGAALVFQFAPAHDNYIQYSHFTHCAHDTGVDVGGSRANRWLNNLHDGGLGLGWGVVQGSGGCLVEGCWFDRVMSGFSSYKPGVQLSGDSNTFRRNLITNCGSHALEVSSIQGGEARDNKIYNNIFYNCSGAAIWYAAQANQTNNTFANNVMYAMGGDVVRGGSGFENYLYINLRGAYTGELFTHNAILFKVASVNGGAEDRERGIICINCNAFASSYKSVSGAASSNSSEFVSNIAPTPSFVNLTTDLTADFHVSGNRGLIGQGTTVADPTWGTISGNEIGVYEVNAID